LLPFAASHPLGALFMAKAKTAPAGRAMAAGRVTVLVLRSRVAASFAAVTFKSKIFGVVTSSLLNVIVALLTIWFSSAGVTVLPDCHVYPVVAVAMIILLNC
jgi:hypothetical protein